MESRRCEFCRRKYFNKRKESFSKWRKRKFCSTRCSGKFYASNLTKRNKVRRKYPEIKGLSRQQVYYRYNFEGRKRQLEKDKTKREFLIKLLGSKCIKCGYKKDIRALQVDHRNGDGYLDRKQVGSKIYRYYCKHMEEAKQNLQVLCANCNKIKQKEKQEYNYSRRLKNLGGINEI